MADKINADSSDTKTIEKSPLTLDKLPLDVLKNVTGWLPLVDCLSLRKVSRDLRSFVDSSEGHCKALRFCFGDGWVRMNLDGLELTYERTEDDGCEINSNRIQPAKTRKYLDDRNYKHALIADASTFLKVPKLEIGVIELRGYETAKELDLVQLIKSRNSPLDVRSIRGDDLETLHSIQEVLNPQKLEEILYDGFTSVIELNEIVEPNLEILKNPKLKFEEIIFSDCNDESAAKLTKILKSIDSQLHIKSLVVLDERWIFTIVQSLDPEKVENVIESCVELNVDQFNEIARIKQWKAKTRLLECDLPEEIRLEQLVDFKEIRSIQFDLAEENLIIIRDILLESPHLDSLKIEQQIDFEEDVREMMRTVDRIMSEHPAYNSNNRRFSIPNSRDYFHLDFEIWQGIMELIIERTSPQ